MTGHRSERQASLLLMTHTMPPDTNAEIRQRIGAGLVHLQYATEQLESAMARLDEIDVRSAPLAFGLPIARP